MKKVFVLMMMVAITGLVSAQKGSKELYALFPPLPSKMTNDQFKALLNSGTELDTVYYRSLGEDIAIIGEDKIFAIGQYVAGSTIHLFYTVLSDDIIDIDGKYLMTTACISYKKGNGEVVAGGKQHYLAMTGDDALHRESSFTVDGAEITFEIISTDNTNNSREVERTTYKMDKFLQFVSQDKN